MREGGTVRTCGDNRHVESGGTDWTTLIVGGAAGAVATALIAAVVWLRGIPGALDANTRAIADLDEDLGTWVADAHVKLKRELRRIRNELNARGAFHSGEHGYQVGLAKERALHAYRDQERRAKREAAEIRASEGWLHRQWRWVTTRPELELRTPDKAAAVLDAWRLPATRHLSETDTPAQVDDPTARTLDGTLAEVAASTAEMT